MSEFTSQLVESVTNLPTGIEHPIAVAGILAATVATNYALNAVHGQTQEKYSADFPNPALLEASIMPDSRRNTRVRLGSVSLLLAGVGLVGAQYVGNPHSEVSHTNNNANLVVVEDVSNSMLLTHDMDARGTTRAAVTATAITKAAFPGSLAVIQTAAANKVVLPLTHNWQTKLPDLSRPQVDPNGGLVTPALELAASLLPANPKTHQRSGNILLVSDGTVTDSAAELKVEAAKLKTQGINLRIVVPGSKDGSYKVPNTTAKVSSVPQPERFSGLADNDVIIARNAKATEQSLHQIIRASGQTHEQQSNILLGTIGWVLIGLANIGNIKQRITKVV